IFTPHGRDLNIEHSITFRATVTAVRPIKRDVVKSVYMYEVPSATEWSFGKIGTKFTPNVFVDIHKTLDRKLEAMKMYETELREFPHPRSGEALRAVAVRWGSVAGFEAAEAFELFRELI
ncbi:MAG: hypothetical protein L6290_10670, partial [Thermodesulfovibrionales bacterium]|nr:hypothetical protein [Thermodesulfovibrionales bacterium]